MEKKTAAIHQKNELKLNSFSCDLTKVTYTNHLGQKLTVKINGGIILPCIFGC